MRALLTGATGFIGSNVARELVRRGHEVVVSVRPGSDRRRIRDLEGRLTIQEGDAVPADGDTVIHLAWIATPGAYLESPENRSCLEASRRLLARAAGRAIVAGSCFEFDTRLGRLSEDSPVRPTTLYARSKDELRQEVERRPDSVWVRLFYQYGPGEHPQRFVPSVIRSLLRGQETKLSPGEQRRDYLHVSDVAAAVVAIAESRLTGCVNVGSGDAVSVKELATTIGDLVGRADLLRFGALPYWDGEPMLIVASNDRLRSTGWASRTPLREGLAETVAWWRRENMS
jgi:nucleoside-diphosphate-sugar epimerase